ncbi:amidase [Anaeroselena agilis]|uniref:Amidase family protein n=1 Tax=Anaeroselena agilis TaxID=3063788 RepID=A0ABU3P1B9_9FIRM|nr:amidase family protein [Selenomonadales bacterium 4137-cl]
MAFSIETATIESYHAALLAGEITARELVQAYLARIAAYDKRGPAVNAVIAVNPRAPEAADELDARLRRRGLTGPLHGVPVLLKDNISTYDMPTTAGSLSLEGYRPRADAFVVARLRAAGAIILAKVNLHEFAVWGETVSSLGGQTLNPYDLTRTPGGSSGGTGAGLAAAFGLAGLGTDTVNSVRSPASANGLAGIKPTLGMVSRTGIVPYALTQDTAGPLAYTVADAARVLGVIAGYDEADPVTAWSVGQEAVDGWQPAGDGLRGARLGVVETLFGGDEAHREVNAVMDAALARLREGGATLVTVSHPALDAARLIAETSVHVHEFARDLSAYLADPAAALPVKSLAEVAAGGRFHPGIADNIRQALAVAGDVDEYRRRLVARDALRQTVMELLARHRLDALVYPHQKRLVVPVGEPQADRNGVVGAVTGFPAVVVPGGFSRPTATAPLGVPVGVELLGRPWSERLLVRLAHAFEQMETVRRLPLSTPLLS